MHIIEEPKIAVTREILSKTAFFMKKHFSPETKMRLVLELHSGKISAVQLARKAGTSRRALINWRDRLKGSAQLVFARPDAFKADLERKRDFQAQQQANVLKFGPVYRERKLPSDAENDVADEPREGLHRRRRRGAMAAPSPKAT